MNELLKTFLSAYLQVFLVTANTYIISQGWKEATPLVAYLISYFWANNVRKVNIGNKTTLHTYCLGAATGGYLGLYLMDYLNLFISN